MPGLELLALQLRRASLPVEIMHAQAEVAQPLVLVDPRPLRDELGQHLAEREVAVEEALEVQKRRDERPGLAHLDAGCDEEEDGVEVVLLRDDAALAQELGEHRSRNAPVEVSAGLAVEAGRDQRELVRVGHRVAVGYTRESMPACAGL